MWDIPCWTLAYLHVLHCQPNVSNYMHKTVSLLRPTYKFSFSDKRLVISLLCS